MFISERRMSREMRRDPLSIVSILIQTLESLNENTDYNFNEVSNRSNLHWETVKKYIFLIKHIQNLAPIIEIESNKFRLMKKVKDQSLNIQTKLLLSLFYSKAFHEETAINIVNQDKSLIKNLIDNEFIQETNNKFFLTDSGKRTAFRFYKKNRDSIYQDFLQLQSNLPPEPVSTTEKLEEKVEELSKKCQVIDNLSSKIERLENIIQNTLPSPTGVKPSPKINEPKTDDARSSLLPINKDKKPEPIYT